MGKNWGTNRIRFEKIFFDTHTDIIHTLIGYNIHKNMILRWFLKHEISCDLGAFQLFLKSGPKPPCAMQLILSRNSAVLTSFAFMAWPPWKIFKEQVSLQFLYWPIYKSYFHKLSFALFISERKAKVKKKTNAKSKKSLKTKGKKKKKPFELFW